MFLGVVEVILEGKKSRSDERMLIQGLAYCVVLNRGTPRREIGEWFRAANDYFYSESLWWMKSRNSLSISEVSRQVEYLQYASNLRWVG